MKKKIGTAILLIALIIGVYIYYRVNKPRPSLDNATPTVSIAATELYRQYQANETAADSQYADKVIEVTGVVTDIQKGDSSLSIELKGGDMGGVNCGVAWNSGATNTVQKGSTITVKGKCSGFLMDVTLTDCVIENKH